MAGEVPKIPANPRPSAVSAGPVVLAHASLNEDCQREQATQQENKEWMQKRARDFDKVFIKLPLCL